MARGSPDAPRRLARRPGAGHRLAGRRTGCSPRRPRTASSWSTPPTAGSRPASWKATRGRAGRRLCGPHPGDRRARSGGTCLGRRDRPRAAFADQSHGRGRRPRRPPGLPRDAPPMVATVGSDRTCRLWQPTIGRMVRLARLPSPPLAVSWVSREASTMLAVACNDGHVRLIDPDTVAILRTSPPWTAGRTASPPHPAVTRSPSVAMVVGSSGWLLNKSSSIIGSQAPLRRRYELSRAGGFCENRAQARLLSSLPPADVSAGQRIDVEQEYADRTGIPARGGALPRVGRRRRARQRPAGGDRAFAPLLAGGRRRRI